MFAATAPPPVTTPDAADVAVAEPAEFVAVTLARTVEPASPLVTVYVHAVAPAMSAHDAPDELQRRHLMDVAGDPSTCRGSPSACCRRAVPPLTVGAVFDGAARPVTGRYDMAIADVAVSVVIPPPR